MFQQMNDWTIVNKWIVNIVHYKLTIASAEAANKQTNKQLVGGNIKHTNLIKQIETNNLNKKIKKKFIERIGGRGNWQI